MTVRKELLNNIRIVDPYVPGEQPRQKVVKLNTNENPYPPAPEVKAVFDELKEDEFRLYPDPTADLLVRELEKAGIPATIIGKATAGNDRVLLNEEERRFLEPPKADELYKAI